MIKNVFKILISGNMLLLTATCYITDTLQAMRASGGDLSVTRSCVGVELVGLEQIYCDEWSQIVEKFGPGITLRELRAITDIAARSCGYGPIDRGEWRTLSGGIGYLRRNWAMLWPLMMHVSLRNEDGTPVEGYRRPPAGPDGRTALPTPVQGVAIRALGDIARTYGDGTTDVLSRERYCDQHGGGVFPWNQSQAWALVKERFGPNLRVRELAAVVNVAVQNTRTAGLQIPPPTGRSNTNLKDTLRYIDEHFDALGAWLANTVLLYDDGTLIPDAVLHATAP
jgi:hypothetical protein